MLLMNALLTMLQKAIEKREVTVTDLARKLECSRQHIYDILKEDPKTSVTVYEAELIAQAIGCSLVVKSATPKRQKISA